MTSTQPPTKKTPSGPKEEDGRGRASEGSEGGAPANEEDIGTEGAGTESPDITDDTKRNSGTTRRDKA